MKSSQHREGFTLIELLVVISIIALLVALLLPALASARQSALTSQCMSNQRQFGLANVMYMDDWEEWTPNGWGYDIGSTTGPFDIHADPRTIWPGLLLRYTENNVDIFLCPEVPSQIGPLTAEESAATMPVIAGERPNQPNIRLAYGMNFNTTQKRLGEIPETSGTVIYGDRTMPTESIIDGGVEVFGGGTYGIWVGVFAGHYPSGRHLGSGNLSFLDGHVSTLFPDMGADYWTP